MKRMFTYVVRDLFVSARHNVFAVLLQTLIKMGQLQLLDLNENILLDVEIPVRSLISLWVFERRV